MVGAVSMRVRTLILVLVLSVVAAGGWLIKMTSDGNAGVSDDNAYRGPRPAVQRHAVTPGQRRDQTRDRAKPVKPHGLPTTRSKPATAAQIALLKQNQRQLKTPGPKAANVP